MLNTREDWLNWRRGGIGSSDAAAIMGVSPWRTPLQVWEEKVLGSSQADNFSMRRGREMEEAARQSFEKKMNVSVFPKNIVSSSTDWLRASLDGIDIDRKVMVEIKCPNKEDHSVALNDMVPDKYIPQVQHQLAVTGLDGMYYYSFDGYEGAIVEVARDDQYLQELLEREQEFWDLVLKQEPPKASERDFLDMSKNEEWKRISEQFYSNSKLSKEFADKAESLKEELKILSGNKSARGHSVELSSYVSKGSIDYSKIPELAGVDLDKYRKPSFTKWRTSFI